MKISGTLTLTLTLTLTPVSRTGVQTSTGPVRAVFFLTG